jgi:hypothetical protein
MQCKNANAPLPAAALAAVAAPACRVLCCNRGRKKGKEKGCCVAQLKPIMYHVPKPKYALPTLSSHRVLPTVAAGDIFSLLCCLIFLPFLRLVESSQGPPILVEEVFPHTTCPWSRNPNKHTRHDQEPSLLIPPPPPRRALTSQCTPSHHPRHPSSSHSCSWQHPCHR